MSYCGDRRHSRRRFAVELSSYREFTMKSLRSDGLSKSRVLHGGVASQSSSRSV